MSDQQEQSEAKLLAYIEGELDPATRAEIERHLESNPHHQRMLGELVRTRDLMRWLPREAAPVELAEQFQGQLERQELLPAEAAAADEPDAYRINRWSQFRAVAAILVLAAGLGLVILFVLNGPPGTRPLASNPSTTNPALTGDGSLPDPVATTPAELDKTEKAEAPDEHAKRGVDGEGRRLAGAKAGDAADRDSAFRKSKDGPGNADKGQDPASAAVPEGLARAAVEEQVLVNTARNAWMVPAVQQALAFNDGTDNRQNATRGAPAPEAAPAAPAPPAAPRPEAKVLGQADRGRGTGGGAAGNYAGGYNANGSPLVVVVSAPNPDAANREIASYLSSNRIAFDNVDRGTVRDLESRQIATLRNGDLGASYFNNGSNDAGGAQRRGGYGARQQQVAANSARAEPRQELQGNLRADEHAAARDGNAGGRAGKVADPAPRPASTLADAPAREADAARMRAATARPPAPAPAAPGPAEPPAVANVPQTAAPGMPAPAPAPPVAGAGGHPSQAGQQPSEFVQRYGQQQQLDAPTDAQLREQQAAMAGANPQVNYLILARGMKRSQAMELRGNFHAPARSQWAGVYEVPPDGQDVLPLDAAADALAAQPVQPAATPAPSVAGVGGQPAQAPGGPPAAAIPPSAPTPAPPPLAAGAAAAPGTAGQPTAPARPSDGAVASKQDGSTRGGAESGFGRAPAGSAGRTSTPAPAPSAGAGTVGRSGVPPVAAKGAATPAPPPGAIRPGDTVQLTYTDVRGPHHLATVNAAVGPDGTVPVAGLGAYQCAGLTPDEATRAVNRALAERTVGGAGYDVTLRRAANAPAPPAAEPQPTQTAVAAAPGGAPPAPAVPPTAVTRGAAAPPTTSPARAGPAVAAAKPAAGASQAAADASPTGNPFRVPEAAPNQAAVDPAAGQVAQSSDASPQQQQAYAFTDDPVDVVIVVQTPALATGANPAGPATSPAASQSPINASDGNGAVPNAASQVEQQRQQAPASAK